MDEDEKKMLFNEINILRGLVSILLVNSSWLRKRIFSFLYQTLTSWLQDHPNIVKMYEFFEDEKRYYIVTE